MNTNSKTVLLVEDDKFLSSLLKNRLEKEGIIVYLAEDGEIAFEALRQQNPDLVLLDIILPKKTGFEFLEEIQQNPLLKNKPVIIISQLGQEADVSRGKELGAIEYFVKAQTSIEDLVKKIKSFLVSS
ncbi:MAG: response regulator [Candidatus Liptonbacteria bacterium]|nr:response regulator [Candidatus Liptonbacteria bacterium]